MNVFKCLTWTTRLDKILERVETGDTVRFHRGLFVHHAIFTGNGRAIHHHLGPNDGEVIEATLEYLAKGDLMDVMKVADTPFSPEEVVRRARSRIGPLPYSLHDGNCEHFTSWVYYGVRESRQLSGLCQFELRLLAYVKHHGGDKQQQQQQQQQQQLPGEAAGPVNQAGNTSGDSNSSDSSFAFVPPRPPKYRHTKNPARIACNHARSWLKVFAVQSVVGIAAFPLYKCSLQAECLQRLGRRVTERRRSGDGKPM